MNAAHSMSALRQTITARCSHIAYGALLLMGSHCVSVRTHGATKTEERQRTPEDGAVIYSAHPHFSWDAVAALGLDSVCEIQIATDHSSVHTAVEDRIENVRRYVSAKPLAPGRYWWRIRTENGGWSPACSFEVTTPRRTYLLKSGSGQREWVEALREAASHSPAEIRFEPGEYHLGSPTWQEVARLKNAHDIIIEGNGAHVVLDGTLVNITECQGVTLQHLFVTGVKPGHTLVKVSRVDRSARTITVRPEPGYDADVPRFFGAQGFLNRVDPIHRGKHLGGFVSTKTATAQPSTDEPGSFIIGPVGADAIAKQEEGGLCVLTRYGAPFVDAHRTQALTFSDITLVDLPGAFCGGSENDAKSYLHCKVSTRNPQDYQGGHSAVGDGRTGEWVEGCEFQMLADDGPNVRTMRMKIEASAPDNNLLLSRSWTNTDLRKGDVVAIVNPVTFATATSPVISATRYAEPAKVEIGSPLQNIAATLGLNDLKDCYLYRTEPSCSDFVYRKNTHIGGRGHGLKFNGRRALIADNRFENITGNAIEIGYSWDNGFEGYGVNAVLVTRNTIQSCGWTPISSESLTSIAGNIAIKDNHISQVRDAAIMMRRCDGVIISGNTFESAPAPAKGAWIITRDVQHLKFSGNLLPQHSREHREEPRR